MITDLTTLSSWQPIRISTTQWAKYAHCLLPRGTARRVPRRGDDYTRGDTIWGVDVGAETISVCWEWAEVTRGVISLVNPMAVFSNVVLVDEQGHALARGQVQLALNGAIYELDWQREVAAQLDRLRGRGAPRPGRASVPNAPRERTQRAQAPFFSTSRPMMSCCTSVAPS